ncbi:hypothetical protein B7463_g129, partial [Scytalidium lignicola]
MDQLPIELRRQILAHLDLPSIKSFRITSHANAIIGEDYLLTPTFNTLLHRDDFSRLLYLSQCPKYSYRITTLNINFAELNEFHARHNAYFLQFMRVPEDREQLRDETWSTYFKMKTQKEEFARNVCDPGLLKGAFSKLENLRSIAVTLAACPFPSELLQQVWRIPSSRALHRVLNTERFTSILSALASTSPILPITSISHDRLPFEFFAQGMSLLSSIIDPVFRGLKKLSLSLDYSEMPNNGHREQAFSALARCLRCASGLEVLNLSILGRAKTDISPLIRDFVYGSAAADSVEILDLVDAAIKESSLEQCEPDDQPPTTYDLVQGNSDANRDCPLPHLRSLTLSSISTTSSLLTSFILLFSSTLERLEIGTIGVIAPHQPPNGGIVLTEGSFKSLFNAIRREATALEPEDEWRGFWLGGDLVAEESGEMWKLDQRILQSDLETIYKG